MVAPALMALGLLGGGIAASPLVNDFLDRSSRIRDIAGDLRAAGRPQDAPRLLDMYSDDAFKSPFLRENEDITSPYNRANVSFYGQTWDDQYTRGQAWDDMYQQDFQDQAEANARATASISAAPGMLNAQTNADRWRLDPANPEGDNYNSSVDPNSPDYDPTQDPRYALWRTQEEWKRDNAPGEPVNPFGYYNTPDAFGKDQTLYTNANQGLQYIDSTIDLVTGGSSYEEWLSAATPELKAGLQTTAMRVLASDQGALTDGELEFWTQMATGDFDKGTWGDRNALGYLRSTRARLTEAQTQTFSRIMNSLPPQVMSQMYNPDGSLNQQAMNSIMRQYGLEMPYQSRTTGSSIPDMSTLP